MSTYQILLGIILGATGVAAFNLRNREEEKLRIGSLKPGRKTPLVEAFMLPVWLAIAFILLFILDGEALIAATLAACGLLFLYISIYYATLLLLLPLLRRTVSAHACATLWIVPNFLYLSFYLVGYEAPPIFLITLPQQWLFMLAWVWGIGFSGVMIWQLTSHLAFRRFLLKTSEDFTEDAMLALWHNESRRHGVKAQIPVLISGAINTPLTIGCFDRTMRLILPQNKYTDEELALIFRHELRHILRADTRAKMFIGFCAALCWFNPLGWVAQKRMSEDLELSCDEAVLLDGDTTMRRKYAELLLKNAGNGCGYTTCLSAAASTLRYRLHNAMNPGRRLSGGMVIGVALFAVSMMLGTFAVADSASTVQVQVFDKAPPEVAIDGISTYNLKDGFYGHRSIYRWNEHSLTKYIASLPVKRIYTGNYVDDGDYRLHIAYGERVDGEVASLTHLELTEKLLIANIPYDDYGNITFLLEDAVDWAYINTLLDYEEENPDPSPFPPEMMMYFNEDINSGGLMYAARSVVSVTAPGLDQEVREHLDNDDIGGIGGVADYPVTQVNLHFTYAPKGEYIVRIENWERTESYAVASGELVNNTLPLAPYSAHYIVSAAFVSFRDTRYEMEFYFDVILPDAQ